MYKYDDIKKYVKDVKEHKIKIPLKRHLIPPKDVIKMFNKLKKYNYKSRIEISPYELVTVKGIKPLFLDKPVIITSLETDYNDWNILSDIFQEEFRLRCVIKNNESPYDFFYNHTDKVASYAMEHYKIITPHTARESLWKLTKECTSFRPNILMTIIQIFDSKSMLDFSAGWGDRLIGALASNIKYFGVDPNTNLHYGYSKMIECFATSNNYTVKDSTIEDAVIEGTFDLVFTSPPYFDYEIYVKDDKQSSKYNKERSWFDNFLKVALTKCWKVLNQKGILAINIHQFKGNMYVNWMIEFCNTLEDSHYLGVISYFNENKRSAQPIWIWSKGVVDTNKIKEKLNI